MVLVDVMILIFGVWLIPATPSIVHNQRAFSRQQHTLDGQLWLISNVTLATSENQPTPVQVEMLMPGAQYHCIVSEQG